MAWGIFRKIGDGIKKGFQWIKKNKDKIKKIAGTVIGGAKTVAGMIPGKVGQKIQGVVGTVGNVAQSIGSFGNKIIPRLKTKNSG